MPDDLLAAFCGVGNPFSLGPLPSGGSVLDVGCGAGIDLIIASRLVGPTGRVCGIDLTPEMVEAARLNVARSGLTGAEVRAVAAEEIPYSDGVFDVVISNGVLNLSPLKAESFREIRRMLRPGGRLQFADMVLKEELPPELTSSLDAWSD